MTRRRWRWGAVVALAAALLGGCTGAPSRESDPEPIARPPALGAWVEIEGRWDVVADDGEGGALLQPALDISLTDDSDDSRQPGEAVWVNAATGEQVWSRDDVGDVISETDGAVVLTLGAGTDRTIDSIDVGTGESLWSIPASDLGECAGWHAVGTRSDDEAAPWLLAGPAECGDGARTVLAQLDPATGVTERLLEASGGLEVSRVGDALAVLTWDQDGATVRSVDLESADVTQTIEIDAAAMLEGSWLGGRQRLDFFTSPALTSAVSEGAIWLTLQRDDPNDELHYSTTVNEFLLDLAAGTVQRTSNALCDYPGTQQSWYTQWSTSVPYCVALGRGDSSATVSVGLGDEASTWTLPIMGGEPSWRRVDCVDPGADAEAREQPLLLAPAEGAAVVAHDLATGDVFWTIAAAEPGTGLAVAERSDSGELVVLTEEAGKQVLRVLRTCTGDVVSEVAVQGGFLDAGYLAEVGGVVTVALAETTMIAGSTLPAGSESASSDV